MFPKILFRMTYEAYVTINLKNLIKNNNNTKILKKSSINVMEQFYSNDKATIERTIDLSTTADESNEDTTEKYSLVRCTKWIIDNEYQKVALQFPDHLLKDSVDVSLSLQKSCKQMVYIMADTSYESCCVDYINAAHIEADAIVHFGHTCLSKPSYKIPTLFIYEKWCIDVDKFVAALDQFLANRDDDFTVIIDTPYYHKIEDLREKLNSNGKCTVACIGENPSANCIYLGKNDRKLTIFNLTYKVSSLFFYDITLSKIDNYTQNPAILKRRHFLVEKIKDAKSIAICIGTLAITNYLTAITRIKHLCKLHQKKHYTISVGKINVAKLANFPEIDVYVLISCAMNDIFDSREFYRPIVTCYDLELALNPHMSPDTSFTYDFDITNMTLLPDRLSNSNDVSLLTGCIRHIDSDSSSNAVALTGDKTVAVKATGSFVRTWRGLDRGDNDRLMVKKAEEGRKGIASAYTNEIS